MLLTTSGKILGLQISAFLSERRGGVQSRRVKHVVIICDLKIAFLPLSANCLGSD